MKRNVIRLVVYALLIGMILLYVRWNRQRIEIGQPGTVIYPPDKREVQPITCVNNLHMIAAVFLEWERDHGDQYPCNVSTNAGGAREFCAPDKDGFDRNAYLYLKTMGKEGYLTVPKLLICPQDRSTKPAASWEDLQAANITYRFRCGTNVTDANPPEILAVCPVDGNILYADGKVVEKHPTPNEAGQYPMQVR